MSEEIILIYPLESIIVDYENTKGKEITINLYNKTNNNVLYKIICNNQNIFKIKNPLSIVKPLSSVNIIISIVYNAYNNQNLNKYELLFNFYILDNNNYSNSNSFDLNKLLREKIGKENQKNHINIYLSKNKEQINKKDLNKFTKFKTDLTEINNKIKNIINSKSQILNRKKNIFIITIVILLLIIFFGFIFGLMLSRQYNKLFKRGRNKNINKNSNKEDDYVEVKFMSVKEADEMNEVLDENMKKFKELNNFNILNEVKKNRQIKEQIENIHKEENIGYFIKQNIILIFIFLIFFI